MASPDDVRPFKIDIPQADLDDMMDRLKRTHFIDDLNGQVFLSQNRAFRELSANGGPPAEPIGDAARGMI